MFKKVFFLSLIFFMAFVNVAFAGPRSGYSLPVCEYQTSFGLKIESYSPYWNTKEKLRQIYAALMENYVSTEIQKLKVVYIYPDIEEGISGYYDPDIIVRNDGHYAMGDNSYIVLLGCNEDSTLDSVVNTLTHEYGHHFTTYYLVTNEQKYGADWINSKYAQIRNLKKYYNVVNYNSLTVNRKWDIAEIAAEDYVQLFGSYRTKKSIDYCDAQEMGNLNISTSAKLAYNSKPQENLELPLASHVSGLYNYWVGMAGGATARPLEFYTSELVLSKKYLIENKYNGYLVKWDTVAGIDNLEYTVVMHPVDNSNQIIPIKTVRTGEVLEAYLGSYKGSKKTVIEYYTGKYCVRLFIKDSNGFIYEGKSIVIDFSEKLVPISNYSSIFTDLLKNHWAYDYIITLYQNGVVNGYPSKTYKPEGTITRQEFLVLLMRSSNINLTKYKKISNDWFERAGYLTAAKAYGIITENDYGTNYKNFKLYEPISREEITFMIGRVLIANGYSSVGTTDYTKNFSDEINKKYKSEVNIAIKNGILAGYPDGTFKGNKNASRAEVAKMIYKVLKVIG